MAVQDVIDFLTKRMAEGYSLDSLRRYLVQQGIPPVEISAAIKSVSGKTNRKQSLHKVVALGLFFVGTFACIIATIMVFSGGPEGPNNIRLSTGLISSEYEAGTPLKLSLHLNGENLRDPESVLMTYSVYDRSRGKLVFYKTETITLHEDRYESRSIPMPKDTGSGEFVLKTKATLHGKSFVSSFDFSLLQPDVPEVDPEADDDIDMAATRFVIVKDKETTFIEPKPAILPPGREFPGLEVAEPIL
ncbi:MAG: hypothetical protein ABIC95_02965 [archaeon]